MKFPLKRKKSLNANNLTVQDTFLSNEYQQHNVARLQHLESLKLDLSNKKVLEFGAGIGDHSLYYLIKNCDVLPTEGRKELVELIQTRFNIPVLNINVEKDQMKIVTLPIFDIIHCYGFLYHINNPEEFLDLIKDKAPLLLLETCVSTDENIDDIHLVKENNSNPTQAISDYGCRPTRNWIYSKLKRNYKYVYIPRTQPKHNEFPLDWNNFFNSEGNLIRAIFIGSNHPINSQDLINYLPKKYEVW